MVNITFKVTAKEKETIELRSKENGFDDISAYLKVVALKTQPFKVTFTGSSNQEQLVELGFKVSSLQKTKIDEKIEEMEGADMENYLKYVALHAVVTTVVEVRSTGNFEEMLERIAKSKKR